MKFETLNGILTFCLGVLVVAGVVLALNVAFVTHDTRNLQQMTLMAKLNVARAEGLYADAKAYNQTQKNAELARILDSVQTKPTHH